MKSYSHFKINFTQHLASRGKNYLISSLTNRRSIFFCTVCLFAISPLLVKAQYFQEVANLYGVSSFAQGQYGNGLSLYDWNFDGFDDIILCRENQPVKFFRNTGGTFQEVSFAGVEIQGRVNSVSWVDYDNDNDPDLAFNVGGGAFTLFRNDGDFQFTNVSAQCGVSQIIAEGYGQSWGDFDNDGYLDLYLSNYQTNESSPLRTNYLYHNNGDGTFTDVTGIAGVGNGYRMTFLAVWLDYDKDGFIDLYVLNDRFSSSNYLYHNDGDGTFTDVSEESGLSHNFEPMSGTVGDFNNDSWLDLFVSNGSDGNLLYAGSENGVFEEVAAEQGVQLFSTCWSGVWFDANGDMKQDLAVTTSDIFTNQSDVFFFENTGENFFLNQNGDLLEQGGLSYAMGKADFNNDFRPELLSYGASPRGVALWEINAPNYYSIKLALKGTVSNRDGIGSWIEVYSDSVCQTLYTLNGEQYLSQNSQWHIFSTGTNSFADSVVVRWPSGIVDKYLDVPALELLILIEGETLGPDLSANLNPINCLGDTITLDAGVAESYLWSTGQTTPTIQVTESGEYSVQVTMNAMVIDSEPVNIEFVEGQDYLLQLTEPLCYDSDDVQAHIEDLNGNIITQVIWNHSIETTLYNQPLVDSIHYQFIDGNNCASSGYFNFNFPDSLILEVSTDIESQILDCENTWSGDVHISGGTPPYQINWECYFIGEIDPFFSEEGLVFECLPAGPDLILKCFVEDANQCSKAIEKLLTATSFSNYENEPFTTLFHPNPFQHEIQFNPIPEASIVQIYDLGGRLVKTQALLPNQKIVLLEKLIKGAYTIVRLTDKGVEQQLAIKE